MTPDARDAIFTRLQDLQAVDIDHALERGKDYLIERLQDCRRRQDEIGQIAVQVKRALWAARTARRNAKTAFALSKSPADDGVHRGTEDDYDELKALDESVGVCRQTLKAADSDIRLAAALLGTQVYLGNPGSPPASDTAPSVVTVPAEAQAPGFTTAPVSSFDDLFTDEVIVHRPTPQGNAPAGKPPSATILSDPSMTIDLDSLLS